MRNNHIVEVLPGFQLQSYKCNSDPSSFHNIYLYCLGVMYREFGLSIPELVGVQTASELIPNTSVIFVMACNMVLHYAGWVNDGSRSKTRRIHECLDDYALGYIISDLEIGLYNEFCSFYKIRNAKTKTGRTPFIQRMNSYREPSLDEANSWINWCNEKVACIIESWRKDLSHA